MKMLVKSKLEARANGYIDGLLARPSNRLLYPPFDRFVYLAGYADGENADLIRKSSYEYPRI